VTVSKLVLKLVIQARF